MTGPRIAGRLAERGLTLPAVAPPVAAYVPALRTGDLVRTSGQLPFRGGALPATGKVGEAVDVDTAAELAATCCLNALAAVASLVDLDRVVRIVHVTGYVASHPDFTAQPSVVDGASLLLRDLFGDAGLHTRSAVGVAVLPLDAPVEIELLVEVRDPAPTERD